MKYLPTKTTTQTPNKYPTPSPYINNLGAAPTIKYKPKQQSNLQKLLQQIEQLGTGQHLDCQVNQYLELYR